MLPGMLCTEDLFAQQSGMLADDGVRVVHVELSEPSVGDMAERVLSLPDAVFSLVGLSLGGIVAMAVARRAPERVSRLALLSTNARSPRADQLAAWARALRQLESGGTARAEQCRLLPALLRAEVLERDRPLVERVLTMADQVGAGVLAAQLRAQGTRVDARPFLASLRCPTLVVAGRQDALCPVAYHEEIASAVPGARLEVLEDCGHLSTLERGADVGELLREWLAAEPTRSTRPAGEGAERWSC